jgi:hypothetical protein
MNFTKCDISISSSMTSVFDDSSGSFESSSVDSVDILSISLVFHDATYLIGFSISPAKMAHW